MKLVLAAVAAAVLLLTAGTIWVGSRAREDTVVAHPYETGLAYHRQRSAMEPAGHQHPHAAEGPAGACDLGSAACTRTLGDLELTLEVTPRPPHALTELEVRGRLALDGAPVDGAEISVSFEMPGMSMGENVIRLSGAGQGRYRGKAILVRCQSGRRDWSAAAVVHHGGEGWRAAYALRLAE